VVPTEKVVGPGGGLVQGPVTGTDVFPSQRFLLAVRLKSVIGADKDASSFAGENLTPPLRRPAALTVEEELRTLRLRAKKCHLGQRAISAPAAAGTDEFHPVFQFGEGHFQGCSVNALKERASRSVQRRIMSEDQAVEEAHESIAGACPGATLFLRKSVAIETGRWISFVQVESILLRIIEFMNIGCSVPGKFL